MTVTLLSQTVTEGLLQANLSLAAKRLCFTPYLQSERDDPDTVAT